MGEYDFSSNGYLSLTEKELKQVFEILSRRTVGRILKRFEIHDNIKALKVEVKELLYESFRDLEDTVVSVGKGLPFTSFEFKSNNENKGKDTSN
jgi:hypothetical protein